MMLVSGYAGVGKTTLVQNSLNRSPQSTAIYLGVNLMGAIFPARSSMPAKLVQQLLGEPNEQVEV